MKLKIRHSTTIVCLVALTAVFGTVGSQATDDLDLAPDCNVVPGGGLPGLTNDRFYFASELHQQIAPAGSEPHDCGWLQCFLNDVAGTEHGNATLIVDQQCRLKQPIRIPPRFTLAGVGIAGEGALIFEGLPHKAAAIHFGKPGNADYITVRDLTISQQDAKGSVTGLNLSGSHNVSISNISLQNFGTGIYARNSIYVSIEGSNISLNGINLELGSNTSSWRIRDSIMSQASEWSIDITSGLAQEHLISGVRFECNGHGTTFASGGDCHNNPDDHGGGAVRIAGAGVQLAHNRFEGNNADARVQSATGINADRDIVILADAQFTRVLSNNIGGLITDDGQHTECEHNIRFAELTEPAPNTGC